MAVQDILDAFENLIADAKRVPLMNKTMIDETDFYHLLDELRKELPLELQKAEQVIQESQRIIEDAREQAEDTIQRAKRHAEDLVNRDEIVIAAQEKAKAIVADAEAQERDIREKTMENAEKLRSDADQYANQVFDHLMGNLGNALEVIQQAKRDLNAGH
ncbi:hypothetical protein TAMA11512_18710 [Selenomonas sp. TAMA-11512]|uniref:ATPase n=1 Tax=Selenomonas sp. TAMA-11512 TaxID=3095337 RepID=UPI003085BF79|nr:hypothetical protein TAMA11512_18710 [Selenomonas sp. TAMA-11512]